MPRAGGRRSSSTAPRRRRTCAASLPRPTRRWFQFRRTTTAIRCCAPAAMSWRTRNGCAQSSISRPSAFMATAAAPGSTKQHRRSRARRAAANGSPPSKPGWISARAKTSRSPSCASPAFTDPDRMRWSRSPAEKPAASSSRARSSTASTSATSPKRSTPPSRAEPPGFSTSPTTNRRHPPIRSSSPRNS